MAVLAPRHRLPTTPIVPRDAYILRQCTDQQVLHLACVAWPATAQLYESGQLLHRKLQPVCRRLAGMDIDPQGIEELRRRGVPDLHLADLLDAQQVERMFAELGFTPDWLIAGELLEHLDAPGVLLKNLRSYMAPHTRLLVTVPNAFSARGILHVLTGREKVRADHVAYYSYMNLRELISRAGLRMVEFHWYRDSFPRHPLEQLVDCVLAPLFYFRPQFAAGLIAVCQVGQSTDY